MQHLNDTLHILMLWQDYSGRAHSKGAKPEVQTQWSPPKITISSQTAERALRTT